METGWGHFEFEMLEGAIQNSFDIRVTQKCLKFFDGTSISIGIDIKTLQLTLKSPCADDESIVVRSISFSPPND